ncbi:MAG: single-stranded DNA-binding protein [Planctomycetes bacterium]|nr:single-stranded DNA-binding protein [Planctomycetota bacterium]
MQASATGNRATAHDEAAPIAENRQTHIYLPAKHAFAIISPLISMKSVNKVILLGHATRDPELTTTLSGQSVCTFGLATNRLWKDKNGEKKCAAEFHSLVAWGSLADVCAKNVKKGKPLYIEGSLKTISWETSKGIKQYRTEVSVEEVAFLGVKDADADIPSENGQ